MARIYRLSRTGLRLLYKVRHHRGHGIHSPFVFDLINKVIEERTRYHVYDDINIHIDSVHKGKKVVNKYNLLSFRLVNYFGAKRILEIGVDQGINTICLTAPSTEIVCNSVELSEKKSILADELYRSWNRKIKLHKNGIPRLDNKQDCIFIDLKHCKITETDVKYIHTLVHQGSFIVVKGIRTNKQHQALWNNIANVESRTALLDLFNIGIVFFDKKLYRWSYQISF